MHLDPFELHRPTTVEDAVRLASELGPTRSDFVAGGTDLLPNYKMHLNLKSHLIALWDIPELESYSLDRLGAMTRLERVANDPQVRATYPALAEAASEVATPLVRSSGTVGGNLLLETRCFYFNQSFPWRQSLGFCLKADGDRCHVVPQKERCYATFSGDLAPPLLALEATVELAGPDGRRRLPLADLYDAAGDGIRRHHLNRGELLVAVEPSVAARNQRGTYLKLRIRPAFDFPELGVATTLALDDGRVRSLRIAIGGLETYPRRFDRWTEPLIGETLSSDRIRDLSAAIQREVRPVHNTFLAPDYRKKMAGVFVRRTVERLAGATGGLGPS